MYIRFMLWSSSLGLESVSEFGCQGTDYYRHKMEEWQGGVFRDASFWTMDFTGMLKVYLDIYDSLASDKEYSEAL